MVRTLSLLLALTGNRLMGKNIDQYSRMSSAQTPVWHLIVLLMTHYNNGKNIFKEHEYLAHVISQVHHSVSY